MRKQSKSDDELAFFAGYISLFKGLDHAKQNSYREKYLDLIEILEESHKVRYLKLYIENKILLLKSKFNNQDHKANKDILKQHIELLNEINESNNIQKAIVTKLEEVKNKFKSFMQYEVFIRDNPSFEVASDHGYNLLERLISNNKIEIAILLLKVDKKNLSNLLVKAAAKNHLHIIDFLLLNSNNQIDVNQFDWNGDNALIAAISNNHFFLIKILINEYNANVNIQNNSGRNAVMYVAQIERNYILRYFCSVPGIDLNLRDINGDNAAKYALERQNFDGFEVLYRNGLNIFNKNNSGENVLTISFREQKLGIVPIFHYLVREGIFHSQIIDHEEFNKFCLNYAKQIAIVANLTLERAIREDNVELVNKFYGSEYFRDLLHLEPKVIIHMQENKQIAHVLDNELLVESQDQEIYEVAIVVDMAAESGVLDVVKKKEFYSNLNVKNILILSTSINLSADVIKLWKEPGFQNVINLVTDSVFLYGFYTNDYQYAYAIAGGNFMGDIFYNGVIDVKQFLVPISVFALEKSGGSNVASVIKFVMAAVSLVGSLYNLFDAIYISGAVLNDEEL